MTTFYARGVILVIGLVGTSLAWGSEKESSASKANAWSTFFEDGISYRVQGLGYGFVRDPKMDSALNPDNALEVSRYQATGEVRLDVEFVHDNLTLGIKPRVDVTWQEWNFGPMDGESKTDSELFVNEWLVRYGFADQIFASYGRENLQWGPSFLISPSNPFIERNGKANPYLEVPGLDYAKITWIANSTWSAQLIANTAQGRLDTFEPFHKVYAGKLDYVGNGRYGSLIVSQRDGGPTRFGGYGGLTISDAVLAHIEGSVDEDGGAGVLVGGSYTFSDGSTIGLEYYHNSDGCRESQVRACFPPFGDTVPGEFLYRSNYGFVQYLKNEFISSALDFLLRGTVGLDDKSAVITGIINFEIGDHAELFAVADWTAGSQDDEFGSILGYSIMGGVSLTY